MPQRWRDVTILVARCGSIGKDDVLVLRNLGVRDILACDASREACKQVAEQVPGIRLQRCCEDGLTDHHPDTILICTPT